MCQKIVIQLTSATVDTYDQKILIGVNNLIDVKRGNGSTVVQSTGAMIKTNYVQETVEHIYKLINQ